MVEIIKETFYVLSNDHASILLLDMIKDLFSKVNITLAAFSVFDLNSTVRNHAVIYTRLLKTVLVFFSNDEIVVTINMGIDVRCVHYWSNLSLPTNFTCLTFSETNFCIILFYERKKLMLLNIFDYANHFLKDLWVSQIKRIIKMLIIPLLLFRLYLINPILIVHIKRKDLLLQTADMVQ